MKVLVTGAAGFIGSNLLHFLADQRPDWDLVAVDLLTYAGNLQNISGLLNKGKAAFAKADITDPKSMAALFESEQFDVVFHLAAESHVDRSIMSGLEFAHTNVVGTQVLLDCAVRNKVARFVHISTDEVYGSLGPTGRFIETTPLDPTSAYSASKASSDLMVLACHKTHKLNVSITRCTNNYGPYQFPEKFIPLFISNAMEDKALPLYGDGMNVRSWIHVLDHAKALLLVAEKGRSGEVYNVGGNADWELPNKIVTEMILETLGKPKSLIKMVADRPAHDRRYAVDCTKIKHELGWAPEIAFKEGLKETIEWYRKNKEWWSSIKNGDYMTYYERNYGSR